MEFNIATPALLFPAISLLLLAYTNRFLTIAQLIRSLHDQHRKNPNENLAGQIRNLSSRIELIRWMQALGILSFFFCVVCMFLILVEQDLAAKIVFALSLLLLMCSLAISFIEITISVRALKIQLTNCGKPEAGETTCYTE